MGVYRVLCLFAVISASQAVSTGTPPAIIEAPQNLTGVDGSRAVLRFRVSGEPRPVIVWTLGNIPQGGKFITTETTPEGDLVINGLSFSDAGKWEVTAINAFGVQRAWAILTVKRRTVITDKPEDIQVAADSTVIFRCNANTDESLNLDISWYRDGEPIDYTTQPRFNKANDYSLYITKAAILDSGIYMCVAKTELDEARAQAKLTVK